MNLFRQHPATRSLQRQQGRAKLVNILRGFRSPRRLVLSTLGLLMAILWVGQAIVGVLLRQAADPERLSNWLTLGLTAFLIWNVLKVVFRTPVEPFEWTDAEKEWLAAAPLTRGQLIRFRIAGISKAAMFKSAVFTLVMIPDLNILPPGFAGLYLGLMFIELIRMGLEILVFGMTRRERVIVQIVTGFLAAIAVSAAGTWYFGQWQAGQFTELFSIDFIHCTMQGMQALPGSSPGQLLCVPFGFITEIILAESIDLALCTQLIVGLAIVKILCERIESIDSLMSNRANQTEKGRWRDILFRSNDSTNHTLVQSKKRRWTPPHLRGAGSLIWRQLLGVNRYRSTVAIALLVPLAMALAPAFGAETGRKMVEKIVVLVACYSFLLLPTALKFDFRRDLDRINVLKALPVPPMAITIGQLFVPVLLTSVFQLTALSLAMLVNPFHPGLIVIAMIILIPVNVFIFGLENLLFLLYPYRINGEGIDVFLRTILTFTGKGILMAIGMAAGLGCLLLSVAVSRSTGFANQELMSLAIFTIVGGIALTLVAALVVWMLARAFRRLDPSQDLAAAQA